jgi:predicted aspartyl protease
MTRAMRNGGVGRFKVEIDVANNDDLAAVRRGALDPKHVRRVRVPGIVDSGAARFVLPATVVKELGLPVTGNVKVRYADHRTATRPRAEEAFVEILGRHAVFNAVVEPKRDSALIGAIVLEALDLLVDCTNERLVPRDPRFEIVELE